MVKLTLQGDYNSLDLCDTILNGTCSHTNARRCWYHGAIKETMDRSHANTVVFPVQNLQLEHIECPTPASSHHLAEALCSMPNLTDLAISGQNLTEDFYSTLKAKASSIQDSFPQIRKGNFRFKEVDHDDLDSFFHALTCLQSLNDSDGLDSSSDSDDLGNSMDSDNLVDLGNPNVTQFPSIPYIPYQPTFTSPDQPLESSYHGNTYNTINFSLEQSRAMYQETMASTSRVNPVHANIRLTPDTLPLLQESQDNVIVRQPLQQPRTLRTQSGIWPVYLENNALPWNSGPSQP
ncbi:uncharacterized protein LOC105447086 [Strongylocentrotus purpuratus]|uniref:Uncharacterized protein n=1 Tax=Strongylocentrotus purpuratus TaxID=7668 RepID=A0A7M7ND08_STRPU|nr:uncharacterized protein LOC105447086 [Strongylocentrotus purpuratus]